MPTKPIARPLIIEGDKPPPAEVVAKVAKDTGVDARHLTFVYAPTRSLAGSLQVVARVLEVALHKAHELKFPLSRVIDGIGTAPLSPPHPDFVQAMGRTNDAIIYGGLTHLFVTRAGRRGARARREIAEQDVARLRRALLRHLQEIQRRFLQDRSDAVQSPRSRS